MPSRHAIALLLVLAVPPADPCLADQDNLRAQAKIAREAFEALAAAQGLRVLDMGGISSHRAADDTILRLTVNLQVKMAFGLRWVECRFDMASQTAALNLP